MLSLAIAIPLLQILLQLHGVLGVPRAPLNIPVLAVANS